MRHEPIAGVAVGAVLLLWLAYAALVQGDVLLGLLPPVFLGDYGIWWVCRSIRDSRESLRRIAEQLERME